MKRVTLLWVCLALGCGQKVPPYSAKDQLLLKRMQDQIEKRNLTNSKQLCSQVEDMHRKNKMTDEHHKPLHSICEKINSQRWDEAKEMIDALIAAQTK